MYESHVQSLCLCSITLLLVSLDMVQQNMSQVLLFLSQEFGPGIQTDNDSCQE